MVRKAVKGTEFTFFPSEDFKIDFPSDHDDVGIFVEIGDVLKLKASKRKKLDDITVISIAEGRVEIVHADWEDLIEKGVGEQEGSGSSTVNYDIGLITDEYLSP